MQEKKTSKKFFKKNEEFIQRKNCKSVISFIIEASPLSILVSPIIYSLIIPLVIMDFCVWFYQLTCFPVYKLNKVKRNEYVVFDRGNLKYLNFIERFNCNFCAYVNGVIAYCSEIASLTEQYFCPIKHLNVKCTPLNSRYNNFLEYGVGVDYQKNLLKIRDKLKNKSNLL